MSIRNLDRIFKPQRIAVIGASDDPASLGHPVMRNLIGSGFNGVVYPVNAKREAVLSIQAYPNVRSLPRVPDVAVVCTPARGVPAIVRECGEAGILGMVIISAGFREVGEEGRALEQQIREEAAQFDGLRIIGPNCLGIIVPWLNLNVSFATAMPKAGRVAFISQSGALCTSVLDWARQEGIGFSFFVSIGNMLDVNFGDLIDYFGADSHTHSILLYIESITKSREFMSAARAFARSKPIVAYKAGRFAESAEAAASHTGALAGEDAVYDAAFQRAGIVRVYEINDMFECAELLGHRTPAKGPRLAIITNAGGPGVMATDALMSRAGTLARVSDATYEKLNASLPPFWSHNNPIDILDDAPPDRFGQAIQTVLPDPAVDAALVILTPQAMTDPTQTARAVANVASQAFKPILAAWMGGRDVQEGINILNQAHIPTYTTPEQAVRAFMHLVSYARNLEILYETPRDVPMSFTLDRDKQKSLLSTLATQEREALSEATSKSLLEAYGIPVIRPHPARTAEEAVQISREIGYPVVLKVLSPQITHKTDVGGVVLDLQTDDEVRAAFERIVRSARDKRPDATVEGVVVQRMVNVRRGFELIMGAKQDPTFGSVIMVGTGGVAAEILHDRALGLPPLNERLARRMLESLKSWPLLRGYRGNPGVNLEKLIEILMRFSYLVAEHPQITEFDVNPVLATADDVIALDARVILDRDLLTQPPYSHLVIRPYPQELVRCDVLKDGRPITLRPIKPEDEPLWHAMFAVCSQETIRFRFRYLFKETTHEMAARYCYIDYDRELALVAELQEEETRKIIGSARLVKTPDGESADYAVLVADPWQGCGLGEVLTRYCLDIAHQWGIQRVIAETTADNTRMLAIFRKYQFQIEQRVENEILLGKSLAP